MFIMLNVFNPCSARDPVLCSRAHELNTIVKTIRQAAAIIAAALFLAGAMGCGSTKVSTQTNSSVGQQLMDLEKAHNDGIISDKEYEKLKKALIKKHD